MCSRTVPWSLHLFSSTNIPQLHETGSCLAEQGFDIRVRTPFIPDFAPLVQCEFDWSTPLAPIPQLQSTTPPPAPPQRVNSKPVDPSSQPQPILTLPGYPVHHVPTLEEEEDVNRLKLSWSAVRETAPSEARIKKQLASK